jgi:hypothetical protein
MSSTANSWKQFSHLWITTQFHQGLNPGLPLLDTLPSHCGRAAIWWSLSSALSPVRLETALGDSQVFVRRVVSNSVCEWITCSYTSQSDILVCDRHNLATARFDVWSSNEELTTALHSYVLTGTSYVTSRLGQGSLNRGACTRTETFTGENTELFKKKYKL